MLIEIGRPSHWLLLLSALQLVNAQSGTFDLLAYNVAGLPAILNPNNGGDKTVNARAIGAQLAAGGYDVVHLQEVRTR